MQSGQSHLEKNSKIVGKMWVFQWSDILNAVLSGCVSLLLVLQGNVSSSKIA